MIVLAVIHGSAALVTENEMKKIPIDQTSVFTAEAFAILQATNYIRLHPGQKFIIQTEGPTP